MDYVVGGVAALITGHATPDRPKTFKKALTPRKHEPSPNVTPRSESDDRSIFLSPSVQRKKAIVKKSPKRIFQNPDLDETLGEDGDTLPSPKSEKVKKHLKKDLDVESANYKISPQKPNGNAEDVPEIMEKKGKNNKRKSISADGLVSDKENDEEIEGKKHKVKCMSIVVNELSNTKSVSLAGNEKKKKKNKLNSEVLAETVTTESTTEENVSRKKKNKKQKKPVKAEENAADQQIEISTEIKAKSKKKKKNKQIAVTNEGLDAAQESLSKKKNKKSKNKQNQDETEIGKEEEIITKSMKKNKNLKTSIADTDSESEHESDDENMESDNERSNIEMLELPPAEGSSDEEEPESKHPETAAKKKLESRETDEDEMKRTLFVGNVPFSKKCKKEMKRIFGVYGKIETVRIRSVPVKDARFTQKVAVIKNELHPENSSVNVYVKFQDADSVEKALVENNRMVSDHHIHVTRCTEGADWDPRKAVFVGNLPFKMSDDGLRQVFINCGDIHSVRIVRDKKTKAGKGFGYVNFMSKDGVELALGLSSDELTVDGRELRVKRCNAKGNNAMNRSNNAMNRSNNTMNRSNNTMNRSSNAMNRSNNAMNRRNNATNRGGAPAFPSQPPKAFGAYARIMKKRQFEGDFPNEPQNKRPRNITQPNKEKKSRKEYVGVTATGKKKKQKFDKGQKKKKMLSQILTKTKEKNITD